VPCLRQSARVRTFSAVAETPSALGRGVALFVSIQRRPWDAKIAAPERHHVTQARQSWARQSMLPHPVSWQLRAARGRQAFVSSLRCPRTAEFQPHAILRSCLGVHVAADRDKTAVCRITIGDMRNTLSDCNVIAPPSVKCSGHESRCRPG